MTDRYSCEDEEERDRAIHAAADAVRSGAIVVFPTDTVYGVGGDAFDPGAVRRLLRAKGRGREMPPPVLVSAAATLDALTTEVSWRARALIDAFWPGPLTVVCKQQASLNWDLGDSRGTVAVRMPDHELALALLARTGPLAVSSANRTGQPPATTAAEAEAMLGESVEVYLDAGPVGGGLPSTIVDGTSELPSILRVGALPVERLREIVPDVQDLG